MKVQQMTLICTSLFAFFMIVVNSMVFLFIDMRFFEANGPFTEDLHFLFFFFFSVSYLFLAVFLFHLCFIFCLPSGAIKKIGKGTK